MKEVAGVSVNRCKDDVENEFKVCGRCDQVLPIDRFYYSKQKDIREGVCKSCRQEQNKISREVAKLKKQL